MGYFSFLFAIVAFIISQLPYSGIASQTGAALSRQAHETLTRPTGRENLPGTSDAEAGSFLGAGDQNCPPLTIQPPPPSRFPRVRANNHIAFSNNGLQLLSLKQGVTVTVHSTARLEGRGLDGEFAWSPNARWIAFLYFEPAYRCNRGYLMLADLAAGRVYRLTAAPQALSRPVWSPDSRWIAFTNGDGVLTVTDIRGRQRVLSRQAIPLLAPAWLDLTHVLLMTHSAAADQAGLTAVSLWTAQPRALISGISLFALHGFALSPNRKWLLYDRDPLTLVSLANGEQRFVPPAAGQVRSPDFAQWSPDSRSVLMWLGEGAVAVTQVMTPPMTLTLNAHGVPGQRESWSPDSRSVGLMTDSGITVYNLGTRASMTFTVQIDRPFDLAWSPR